MKTNPIVGKTITALELAADKKALRFVLSDGECVVDVDGDCCSSTWIEHIEMPALGLPALVVAVDDLDMNKPDEGEHGDSVTAFYGCKVTTDRGEIVIDYRNESNGYYGGNLSWPGDYHYGGAFQQNASTHEWRAVGDGAAPSEEVP